MEDLTDSLADGLVAELTTVLDRYDGTLPVSIVVGALEMVKMQTVFDHITFLQESDEDDED